jgi:hypothetical protein
VFGDLAAMAPSLTEAAEDGAAVGGSAAARPRLDGAKELLEKMNEGINE